MYTLFTYYSLIWPFVAFFSIGALIWHRSSHQRIISPFSWKWDIYPPFFAHLTPGHSMNKQISPFKKHTFSWHLPIEHAKKVTIPFPPNNCQFWPNNRQFSPIFAVFFAARQHGTPRSGLERVQPNRSNFVQMEGQCLHQKPWRFRAFTLMLSKRPQRDMPGSTFGGMQTWHQKQCNYLIKILW